jgi:hypothetical protein
MSSPSLHSLIEFSIKEPENFWCMATQPAWASTTGPLNQLLPGFVLFLISFLIFDFHSGRFGLVLEPTNGVWMDEIISYGNWEENPMRALNHFVY